MSANFTGQGPIDLFPAVIRTREFTGKNGFKMFANGYVEYLNSITVSYITEANIRRPYILTGSYNASPFGRIEAGRSRVLKGGPNVGGNGVVYLANITYPEGGEIFGPPLARTEPTYFGQFSGFDVELLDLDGDGRLDAAIGAVTGDYTASNAGATFIVKDILYTMEKHKGKFDLSTCPNPNCTIVNGQINDKLGWRLSKCNITQSPFDDLCITSPFASYNGITAQGATNILRGRTNLPSIINMPINSTTVGYRFVNSQPSSANGNCGMGLAVVNGSMLFTACPSAHFASRSNAGIVVGLFSLPNPLSHLQNVSTLNLNPETSLIIGGPNPTSPFSNPFNFGIGQEIRDASSGTRFALGVNAPYSNPLNRTGAGTGYIVFLPRNGTLDLAKPDWGFNDGYKFIGGKPGEHWGSAIGSTGKFSSSNLPGYFITRNTPNFPVPTEFTVGYIFPGGSKLLETNHTIDLGLVKPDGRNVIAINTTHKAVGYEYWTSIGKNPFDDYNGDDYSDLTINSQIDYSDSTAVGSAVVIFGSASPVAISYPSAAILDDGTPVNLNLLFKVNSMFGGNSTFVTLKAENGYMRLIGSLTPIYQGTFNYSQIESGQIEAICPDQKQFGLTIVNITTVGYAYTPTQTLNITTTHVPRPPLLGDQIFVRVKQGSNFIFNVSSNQQNPQELNVLKLNITNRDVYQLLGKFRLNISDTQNLRVGYGSPNSTEVVASIDDFREGKVAGEVANTGQPVSFTLEVLNDHNQTNVGGARLVDADTITAPILSSANISDVRLNQGGTHTITTNLLEIRRYPGTNPSQIRAQIESVSGGNLLDNGGVASSFTLQDQMNGVVKFADDNNNFGQRSIRFSLSDELYGLQDPNGPYTIVLKTLYRPQFTHDGITSKLTQYEMGYIKLNATRIDADFSNCFVKFPPVYISNGNIFYNNTQGNLVPISTVNVTWQDSQGRFLFSSTFGTSGVPTCAAVIECHTNSGLLVSDLKPCAFEFDRKNFMDVEAAGVALLQGAATELSSLNFRVTDPINPVLPQQFVWDFTCENAQFSSGNPLNQGGIPQSIFTQYDLQRIAYLNAGEGTTKPVCIFNVCNQVTEYCVEGDVSISWTLQPTTPIITQDEVLTVARGGRVGFRPANIKVSDRNTPPSNQLMTASPNSPACVILNNSTGTLTTNNLFPYSHILAAANNTTPLVFLQQDGSLTPCTVSLLAYNGINYSQLFTLNIDFVPYYNLAEVISPTIFLKGLGSASLKDLTIISERPNPTSQIPVTVVTSPDCYIAYRSNLEIPITVDGIAQWIHGETPTTMVVSTSATNPCNASISVCDADNVCTPLQPLNIQFEPLASNFSITSFRDQVITGLQVTGLTAAVSTVIVLIRRQIIMMYNDKVLKRAVYQKSLLSQEIVKELRDQYDLKKCGCLSEIVLERYHASVSHIIMAIQHAIKTDALAKDDVDKLHKVGAQQLAQIIVEEAVKTTNKGELTSKQRCINFCCSTRDVHHRQLASNAEAIATHVIARVKKECPDLLTDSYILQNYSALASTQGEAPKPTKFKYSFTNMVGRTMDFLMETRSLTETTGFRVCCKLTKSNEREYIAAITNIIELISKVVIVDDAGLNQATQKHCDILASLIEKTITTTIYVKFSWYKKLANYIFCRTDIPLAILKANIGNIADKIIQAVNTEKENEKLRRDPFDDQDRVAKKDIVKTDKEQTSASTPGSPRQRTVDVKEGAAFSHQPMGQLMGGEVKGGLELAQRFLQIAGEGGSSSSPEMVGNPRALTFLNKPGAAANAAGVPPAPAVPALPALPAASQVRRSS